MFVCLFLLFFSRVSKYQQYGTVWKTLFCTNVSVFFVLSGIVALLLPLCSTEAADYSIKFLVLKVTGTYWGIFCLVPLSDGAVARNEKTNLPEYQYALYLTSGKIIKKMDCSETMRSLA